MGNCFAHPFLTNDRLDRRRAWRGGGSETITNVGRAYMFRSWGIRRVSRVALFGRGEVMNVPNYILKALLH